MARTFVTLSAGLIAFAVANGKLVEERAVIPSNPIKIQSSSFVGLRNSSNTQGMRDLGFMGNIGNTYMLSFGDGIGVKNINTFDPNAAVCSDTGTCAYITARDGGGLQGDDPLSYSDIGVVTQIGCCGNIPEMGYWCPKLAGEDSSQGLGITNVVGINSTTGIIYTRPTISGSNLNSNGAGLAKVQLTNGDPQCTRPFGKSTWTDQEPDWGQLSAISDGAYVYAYANGYNNGNSSQENHYVLITRAPLTGAFDIDKYQYWNGSAWTNGRVYIPYLNQDDNPYYLVGLNETGQGSVFYSSYYEKYVYINCGVEYYDSHNVYAWVADKPQGPWSSKTIIWNDPGIAPNEGFMYGGFIMPKFTSSDGKTIYFSYTKDAIYEFVISVTFE